MNTWVFRVMGVVRVSIPAQTKPRGLHFGLIFSKSNQATRIPKTDLKST